MKRNILSGLFLVLASQAALAQSRPLSLRDAIDLSLKNSKQLRVSQAKIDQADAELHEAKDRRLPDVDISASYLRVTKPTIDLKLPTDTSGEGGGVPNVEVNQAAFVIANASIPLFSGFRISTGIESSKYLANAAKLDAEHDRDAVIQNAVAAYANLYKAKRAVELVKENLRQSKQRVSDFSSLEQNGLMARNDLLKVQLQQSNVELTLLDAENNFRLATVNTNLMLGLPENTELLPDSNFAFSAEEKGINDWETHALQERRDLQALDQRAKATELGIKAAKGEYYPSVALTGGYIAANVPNFLVLTNVGNFGVGLQYAPSSLWKAGAKVAQAKAKKAQITANQELLVDAVRIQTHQAYENYMLAQRKIEVYQSAVEQANENYRIVKNKSDNNLATTTDLLDADIAQLQAKLNLAYSKADAAVAYEKLLQTTGSLSAETTQP